MMLGKNVNTFGNSKLESRGFANFSNCVTVTAAAVRPKAQSKTLFHLLFEFSQSTPVFPSGLDTLLSH